MSALLPFHKKILEQIHDPATSELLILARGLGLRRIVCTLLKIYDAPQHLVLIVNATQDEEAEIGEELGIMGCRKPGLRVVGYETGNKDRNGGIMSVTSRILVVDMLKSELPTEMVTGIIVLHAERVTPTALEAFIVRLYREKNKTGFLKAFTDQPEHITSGLSPLKNIMKELQLRTTHIYPRFQEDVRQSLERRKADVIELSQNLTESMSDIHHAIIQCMNATLSELKRSNTSLDLDELTVENAYFRSFENIVRRQLDPVWHKVGPQTKQLVNDLGTLRLLLYYLITYDPLQFHAYLETLITSNSTSVSGGPKHHPSPWLLTDAANVIFQVAKRRCYVMTAPTIAPQPAPVIDPFEDVDAWAALDEAEGRPAAAKNASERGHDPGGRPAWLPDGMDPVLEELPKWSLLAEVLHEIEGEMLRQENLPGNKGGQTSNISSDVVLVMTSSTRICNTLTEFLSSMDATAPKGTQGRLMMMRKLRVYLWWKAKLSELKEEGKTVFGMPDPSNLGGFGEGEKGQGATGGGDSQISEALKKKDREKAERAGNRRRVRGGAPSNAVAPGASGSRSSVKLEPTEAAIVQMQNEAESVAHFWASQHYVPPSGGVSVDIEAGAQGEMALLDFDSLLFENEFDEYYGLLVPRQTIVVRAYSNDSDDRMLAELKPRFIVMFEPNMEFIRRIEVYRSSNPGLGVRVYHMIYGNSCEEYKYLTGIRKEKYSFERLIKERGSMLLPIFEERRSGSDDVIRTISSRIAGGRRELNKLPSQVIVDMREFRSTLPSLLHAANLLVIPATLSVGDYILTPDICVERKSLPDLISSFNSGRLYTQCEMMSVHYKHPVLLIEFEEDKAFSLEIVSDLKSYVKPTSKYQPKAGRASKNAVQTTGSGYAPSIQSKIVLLTLTFPRVRIIWSSSPYATAEIFKDLKTNNAEPDAAKAIAVGSEEGGEAGAGVNAAAEDLLRCLPGIGAKNIGYVIGKVGSVKELCEMKLEKVQEILGIEPGKLCWEFMHKGEDKGDRSKE